MEARHLLLTFDAAKFKQAINAKGYDVTEYVTRCQNYVGTIGEVNGLYDIYHGAADELRDLPKDMRKWKKKHFAGVVLMAHIKKIGNLLEDTTFPGCPNNEECYSWMWGRRRCYCGYKDAHGWMIDDDIFYNFHLDAKKVVGYRTWLNEAV